MIRLYRGTEESPLLHPVDAQTWQPLGWSEEKPTVTKPNAIQTQEAETTEALDVGSMESRYLALADLGWREIKQLYEGEYGLGDYPGKDEAIAAILKHEEFE